jgi:hypothetical protein
VGTAVIEPGQIAGVAVPDEIAHQVAPRLGTGPATELGIRMVFVPRNSTAATPPSTAPSSATASPSASLRAVQNRSTCCGTMQLPEFQTIDIDRLATRGPLDEHDILATERDELSKNFTKSSRGTKK